MKAVSSGNLCYIAGLTDGEGSLKANCYRRRTRGQTRGQQYGNNLRIRFADEETIRWLQETFGIGCVYVETNGRYQPMWNWQVSGKQCAEVLKVLLPYLRTRRRQAELILKLRQRIETYKQPRDARGRGLPIDDEENRKRLAIIEQIHRLNQPRPRKKSQGPLKVICQFGKVEKAKVKSSTYADKVPMGSKRVEAEDITLFDVVSSGPSLSSSTEQIAQ